MTAFVSLFRGINVGGHHKVTMVELKELHESLGLESVATYIQSGNVVFTAHNTDPAELAGLIEGSFVKKFGYPVKVMVRSAEQFDEIMANCPFQNQSTRESKWIVVLFLVTSPASTALEDLRQVYTGPEEFHIVGQTMYIYYPESIGNSKLSNTLLEKKLQTSGTARNWNTMLKLQEMLQQKSNS